MAVVVTNADQREYNSQLADARNWLVQLRRNVRDGEIDPVLDQYAEAVNYVDERWQTLVYGGGNATDTPKSLIAELVAINGGLYKYETQKKKEGQYQPREADQTVGEKAYDALIAGKHAAQTVGRGLEDAGKGIAGAVPWVAIGLVGVGLVAIAYVVRK